MINSGDQGFLICFIIFGVLLLVAEVLLVMVDFKYKDEGDGEKETIEGEINSDKE